MTDPIIKTLSTSILNSIEVHKIIYAEVSPPGAMGNSGALLFIFFKMKVMN
jgi:hypothetical protein